MFYMAVVIHEFAHGWCAYKLGDPTAKHAGRLTLNPLAHIDPFGTILLPMMLIFSGSFFIIGYPKPVPVNFRNLGNRKNIALVGLSGPLSNFILATITSIVIKSGMFDPNTTKNLISFLILNLMLGVFNLMPIPPLDGSRILIGLLPKNMAYRFASFEKYSSIILIALIALSFINQRIILLIFRLTIWPIVGILAKLLGIHLSI